MGDGAGGPTLHPGLKVEGYCEYAADFLESLAGHEEQISGVAYLHNAVDAEVADLFQLPPNARRHLYTKQRRGEFIEFLQQHLSALSADGAADRLMFSLVRPSKNLMALAAAEITDGEQFVLLNEQRLAYELVRHAVMRARQSDHKTAVVVVGGPGSGKSTIALSMLGAFWREDRTAQHATGSRSFTQTLRRFAGRGMKRVQSLFKYFNQFIHAEPNSLDVVICDEAHRIRRTSVDRYTKKALRENPRPQVDELLSAARVSVFLLDEDQVVKPDEAGTLETICQRAEALEIEVETVSLFDLFRAGGSSAYEQWVLDLLGMPNSRPQPWQGEDQFELRVAETPWQLEQLLKEKTRGTARMAAGYCWPWSDARPDGSLVNDVVIDDWSRPWSLKRDVSTAEAPGSALWATDPRGFGQVGSVYTAQGFEYDWSGVIIGPDLVARDGRLVTRREYNKDPSLRGRKATDRQADRLIRNIYRVLLTRGMRGTILYAADAETREFLTTLIPPS